MYLDRLKEFPKDKLLIFVSIISFLIVILIEIFVFIPIEADVSTYGILDFEFAWTSARVETIISVWGDTDINNQSIAIYWDFLFIVGYVSLAFALIVLALRRSKSKLQTIGIYIAITPFLTGIFDVIENVNLLKMLRTPTSVSNFNAYIASLSATLKFSFLFIGIIYVIIALISFLIRKLRGAFFSK